MPALTSSQLARITKATYKRVEKDREMMSALDRKNRPFWAWLQKIMKGTSFEGGALVYPVKIDGGVTGTTWQGDDELEASEPDFQLNLEYGYFNYNVAVQIQHDKLKRLGFTVIPNEDRSGDGKWAMSKDEKFKIINYVMELVEVQSDAYDKDLDQKLHRSGAASPTDPVGLFGILTTDPTTGNVGTLSRATYTQLRHTYDGGLTPAAAGDFRSKFTTALRSANLYSQGNGVQGTVDVFFAGQAFIDAYTLWGELNQYQVQRPLNEPLKLADWGIPDTTLHFEGIPIVHNPTFDTLDNVDTYSPTATKRCVGLNSKTWKMRNQDGLHKKATSPRDPIKQRITRMDIDGTYSIGNAAPASNLLIATD
jgi:hypothetical protein